MKSRFLMGFKVVSATLCSRDRYFVRIFARATGFATRCLLHRNCHHEARNRLVLTQRMDGSSIAQKS